MFGINIFYQQLFKGFQDKTWRGSLLWNIAYSPVNKKKGVIITRTSTCQSQLLISPSESTKNKQQNFSSSITVIMNSHDRTFTRKDSAAILFHENSVLFAKVLFSLTFINLAKI